MSDEPTQSYNRPNLNWICTNAEGCGCPGGPTSNGRCPGKSQCTPIRKDSSWKCSRSQVNGGTCEIGPDPSGNCCTQNIGCVPKRNLRSKRRIFVVSCVSVVTGILLLGIWQPNRTEFLAPGGLSANHAQIWSTGNNSDRCVACHDAGSGNPISWLVNAVSGGSHIGQPQYQKCLACHEDTLGKDHALLVHNVSQQSITDVSAKHAGNGSAKFALFASPVNHNGEIACAQCHQEHHGEDHHLAAMTDAQCQSCHQSQFNSFETGHPEFTTLLREKRTKIAFDHFSHQSQHFSKSNQSFDCKSCHKGDQFGSVMQTKPFEQACASCHNEKIDASLSQGLPVFSLPVLDSSLLKRNGLDVGQWPELADGGFDGTIPPLMKVLLSSDPRAADAMKFLGSDFDLLDIDESDSAQLKAAYQLAIATKSLMFDLSANGQVGLADRLKKIGGDTVSQTKLRKMLGNLSADTFIQAQKQWFPDLGDELDLIKTNNNEIPLDIVSHEVAPNVVSQVAPKKSFDILLTTYLQQEQELSPNPLKGLFTPANEPSVIPPTTPSSIQPSAPATSSKPTVPPAATSLESNQKPLPTTGSDRSTQSFQDLPPVDSNSQPSKSPASSSQNPNSNQNEPSQSQGPIKQIQNKFYKSPSSNGSPESQSPQTQESATNRNSSQLDPDVIVKRPDDASQKSSDSSQSSTSPDTLAINPLKGKTSASNNESTQPKPSAKIENPYAQNQNPSPIEPSQLKLEVQDTSPEIAGSTSDSTPTENQKQTTAAPRKSIPRKQIPANELLAENPLANSFESLEKSNKPADQKPTNVNSPDPESRQQSLDKAVVEAKPLSQEDRTKDLLSPNPLANLDPSVKQPQNKGSANNQITKKPAPNKQSITNDPAEDNVPLIPDTAATDANDLARIAEPTKPNVAKKPRKEIERLPANQMVAMGGWYRDDATFTIAYRQAGHADPVTANWYDYVSSIPNANESPMYADFANLMTKSTSPGLCSSCHSVDRNKNDSLSFNWKASYRDISIREFTRFSHRPHLVQGKEDQCGTCHQIAPGSDVMKNYLSSETQEPLFEPGNCEAGFAPMTKSNCIQCHNNRSKIQNCTQCHNYHVGSKVALLKK